MTLSELLDACGNPQSPHHRRGWQIFMNRYRKVIYYHVLERCKSWNVARLKMQFQETVDDIVGDVFRVLCEREFRALQSFRERDNEHRFQRYLITICQNAASHYIKKHLTRYTELDPREISQTVVNMEFDTRCQLYEFVVQKLRVSRQKLPKNFERDINIYMLYVWGDFDKEMIAAQPCYRDRITPKVVDNVVHRMRNLLRENV